MNLKVLKGFLFITFLMVFNLRLEAQTVDNNYKKSEIENLNLTKVGQSGCVNSTMKEPPFYVMDNTSNNSHLKFEDFEKSKDDKVIPRGSLVHSPPGFTKLDTSEDFRVPVEVISVPDDELKKIVDAENEIPETSKKMAKSTDLGFVQKNQLKQLNDYVFVVKNNTHVFKSHEGEVLNDKRVRLKIADNGEYSSKYCCMRLTLDTESDNQYFCSEFHIFEFLDEDNNVVDEETVYSLGCNFIQSIFPLPEDDLEMIDSLNQSIMRYKGADRSLALSRQSSTTSSTKKTNAPVKMKNYSQAIKDFRQTEYYKKAFKAKESEEVVELKEGDSRNDFQDDSPIWKLISAHPAQNKKYKLKGWTKAEVNEVCKAFDAAAKGKTVAEVPALNNHVSNCSTASFLALIKLVKNKYGHLPEWESRIKDQFTCSSPWPKAYNAFIGFDGFKQFMFGGKGFEGYYKTMGLKGKEEDYYKRLKPNSKSLDFISQHDPIGLNRKNGTGHSAIFHSFIDKNGDNIKTSKLPADKICYWTSNKKYNGSSNRCEKLSNINFIDAVKL